MKGGSVGKAALIGGAVGVASAATVGAILLYSGNNDQNAGSESAIEATQELRDTVVTEDNVEDIVEQLQQEQPDMDVIQDPGSFYAQMNYEWNFPTSDSESTDAFVANAEENTTDIYFDIFLAGDEIEEKDPIYQSPILPVGSSIRKIKLSRNLEPGKHECVLVYHLVDKNQNTLSTASFAVTINIAG
jgi:hypothetical protein